MHSSTMCTSRVLTVSQHGLLRGWCLSRGDVCLGGACLGGVCPGVPAWGGGWWQTPPMDRILDTRL